MPRIRVLIVDNSVLIREALSEVLRSDPEIEIAGIASSGEQALQLLPAIRPSLITLDLALPGMSGLSTLVEIRKISPHLPAILFSMFSQPAEATKDGAIGGLNVYMKKSNQEINSPECRQRFRDELIPKIKLLCRRSPAPLKVQPRSEAEDGSPPWPPVGVVAIGASTGGPEALAHVLAKLPANFPATILIVQHLPPKFTHHLADRLDSLSALRVREAKAGRKLAPAEVWIAPGDYHMGLIRQGNDIALMTSRGPAEHGCRPSVDVLFRSVAQVVGHRSLGVVMTGMGADGTSGARAIRDAGGEVIVQDEATSAVWGMPGKVVAAGLAHTICPLGAVASEIMRRVFSKEQPALRARAWAASKF